MKIWRDILGEFRTFLFNFFVVFDRKDFVDGLTPFYWMKWHRQPAFFKKPVDEHKKYVKFLEHKSTNGPLLRSKDILGLNIQLRL